MADPYLCHYCNEPVVDDSGEPREPIWECHKPFCSETCRQAWSDSQWDPDPLEDESDA